MKYCIILGRGIEGCGVTKFTIEMCKWLESNNHEYVVFAAKDKKWSRNDSHDINKHNIKHFKFEDDHNLAQMKHWANDCDYVIINSLPAKNFKPAVIENFDKLLTAITKPIIVLQHDHAINSIRRNACIESSAMAAKLILTHSVNNPYSKLVKELGYTGVLDNFQPGFDFAENKKKYWKSLDTKRYHEHRWIGRSTSWKGLIPFLEFHIAHLKPANKLSMCQGIDSNIYWGALRQSNKYPMNDCLNTKVKIEQKAGEDVYIYGGYVNDEMLKAAADSGFCYQLSLLKPEFIQSSIEYTHCELASIGTIPVFRKAFGERCTHTKYGIPLTQIENSGTIWFDDERLYDTFDTIQSLSNDPVKYDEWRNMAYECYYQHQDSQYAFSNIFKKIENI